MATGPLSLARPAAPEEVFLVQGESPTDSTPVTDAEPEEIVEATGRLARLLAGGTTGRARGIVTSILENEITWITRRMQEIGGKLQEIRNRLDRAEGRSGELAGEIAVFEEAFQRLADQLEGIRISHAETEGRTGALRLTLAGLGRESQALSLRLADLEQRLERLPLGEGDFSLEPEGIYFSTGYCIGQLSGTNPIDFNSAFPLAGTFCQNYELGIRFTSIFRGLRLAIDSELGLIYQAGQISEEIDQDILPIGRDNEFVQSLLEFSVERNAQYHMGGTFYRWYASPAFRSDHYMMIHPSFELGMFVGVIETVDRASEDPEPVSEWLFAPTGAVGARIFEVSEGPIQLFLDGRIRVLVGGVNGTLFEGNLGITVNPEGF